MDAEFHGKLNEKGCIVVSPEEAHSRERPVPAELNWHSAEAALGR